MLVPLPGFRRLTRIRDRQHHTCMAGGLARAGHILEFGASATARYLSETFDREVVSLDPNEGAVNLAVQGWLQRKTGNIAMIHFPQWSVGLSSLLYLNDRIVRGTILVFDAFWDWREGSHPDGCAQDAFYICQCWQERFGRQIKPISIGGDMAAAFVVTE